MYYEEKLINGYWYYRRVPKGNWRAFSLEMNCKKMTELGTNWNKEQA